MSNATLTIEPITGLSGAKIATVDCQHATTTAVYMETPDTNPAGFRLTDAAIAGLALSKHFDEEGCRCTRALRRRYGVTA